MSHLLLYWHRADWSMWFKTGRVCMRCEPDSQEARFERKRRAFKARR